MDKLKRPSIVGTLPTGLRRGSGCRGTTWSSRMVLFFLESGGEVRQPETAASRRDQARQIESASRGRSSAVVASSLEMLASGP